MTRHFRSLRDAFAPVRRVFRCKHCWTSPYGIDHGRDGMPRAMETRCRCCGRREWTSVR